MYERGVKIFKYPHVKDIWVTYLTKFVKRFGDKNLERARELFEHAVDTVCHRKSVYIHLGLTTFNIPTLTPAFPLNIFIRPQQIL